MKQDESSKEKKGEYEVDGIIMFNISDKDESNYNSICELYLLCASENTVGLAAEMMRRLFNKVERYAIRKIKLACKPKLQNYYSLNYDFEYVGYDSDGSDLICMVKTFVYDDESEDEY